MKPAWVGEGAASGPDPRTGRCTAHGSWPGGTEPLLGHRFLRHVPVVYVDYPGPASLTQIYGTFNRAMLRLIPSLRTYAEPLTAAMVEFYTMSQVRSSASGRRTRGETGLSQSLSAGAVPASLCPSCIRSLAHARSVLVCTCVQTSFLYGVGPVPCRL